MLVGPANERDLGCHALLGTEEVPTPVWNLGLEVHEAPPLKGWFHFAFWMCLLLAMLFSSYAIHSPFIDLPQVQQVENGSGESSDV